MCSALHMAAMAAMLLVSGCASSNLDGGGIPQPAYEAPGIDVVMYTDPVTGRMDGPFDRATGMRVLTQVGADGVQRVVLDAVSGTPVLLHEQQAPVVVAQPTPGYLGHVPAQAVPDHGAPKFGLVSKDVAHDAHPGHH